MLGACSEAKYEGKTVRRKLTPMTATPSLSSFTIKQPSSNPKIAPPIPRHPGSAHKQMKLSEICSVIVVSEENLRWVQRQMTMDEQRHALCGN